VTRRKCRFFGVKGVDSRGPICGRKEKRLEDLGRKLDGRGGIGFYYE